MILATLLIIYCNAQSVYPDSVKSKFIGWEDEFKTVGQYLVDNPDLTPKDRCERMSSVFDKVIIDDATNGYICVCFETPATEQETEDQVFWDVFQTSKQIATNVQSQDRTVVMFGVEVNIAIFLRRRANWFHTRWNISHTEPDFDTTSRNDIDTEYPGCGKVRRKFTPDETALG